MPSWTRSLVVVAITSLVACGDNRDGPPDAPPRPACSDGIDNDHDGKIDFPRDPGCSDPNSEFEDAPVRPQCSDNRDNDGDGLIDYPNDPGCLTPQNDDEKDDCPNGPYCPQCANGVDDDLSGSKDYPLDPGCESAADNFEYAGSSAACGAGLALKQLPASGMATGTTDMTSVSNISTTCGGGGGAPAIGYIMVLTKPTVVVISTAGSNFDTVLDLRQAPCMGPTDELECHDNVSAADNSSRITRSLGAGVYYILVEGKTATQSGPYVLTVQKFKGEGETCTVQGDCGPGLVCRIPAGGSQKICTKPVCRDGLDDDGDGKIDYPNDPGCDSPDDSDETDDCPSGPNCPDCADGIDNDSDGSIDYPADTSCKAAGDASEACTTSEPITLITQTTIQGDTTNAVDDYDPTCNSGTSAGKDLLYRLDLPAMQRLTLNVTGFDTVHTLLNATCGGAPVACSDPALMTVNNLAAGTYYLDIDAWSTASGPFTLVTSGFIALGGSCEGTLYQNGVITCPTGASCFGPAGARTCLTECTDGIDNNGDGRIDYPTDPGCSSPLDNLEDTVCPGATCPQCADGIDNDLDGAIDYPADTSCIAAGSTSEACDGERDPVGTVTAGTTMDTLAGAFDDHNPSCGSDGGPDKLFIVDLPAMATLQIDTIGTGFDTILSLISSTCHEPSIQCDDDSGGSLTSKITRTNVPAGLYYAAVDAYSTTTVPGAFNLHVSGTVALGGSCEGVLFQAGAIMCIAGTTCGGSPGARTCSTECTDGLDNNGDGRIDWPSDPGCAAPLDPLEDTVCPGATCPACADGVDNDSDGAIDWPMDTSCPGAGGTSESCVTTEPIGAITTAVTNGTTVGATNDYDPTCNSATGLAPDVVYRIDLPAMALLNLNVAGFDTVTTLFDSSCLSSLVCSDPQLLTTSNLAAGAYFVSIEGFSGTTAGAFTLTTSGQVAAGGSCEGALFQSGAFTCQAGFACDGVVGARTCRTECTDGIDNNGDGLIDYPNDPGCSAPSDNSESTVCPGAACPACSDGIDNDGDTLIDYPMDPQCYAAGGVTESCRTSEGITPIVAPSTIGSTAGQTNDYKPICGSVTNHSAPDLMYQLDVPQLQSLTTGLTFSGGLDGVTSLLDATCSATPIACSDPVTMTVNNLAAGRYFVVVDGSSNAAGVFTLTTAGVIAPSGSCESPLFTAGVLTCPTGTTCQGPAGAKQCVSQCSDGIDNNGDGNIDFPFDPGCDSVIDNTEASTCPGAGCPVCGNGNDEDSDGLIDFPADFGCKSAAGPSEVFCAGEPDFAGLIDRPTLNGSLAAPAAGNYNQTCQTNTGADVAFALSLPVIVQTLRIDTFGSTIQDTVLSVKDAQCSTQLGCNDDSPPGNLSALTLINVQPGNYAIQVDSYNANGTNNGPFTLNVRGTVSPGTACTSPLFASGVLACVAGTSCTAGTCQ